MTLGILGFVLLVLACLVYLHKDKTEWKLIGDRLSLFTTNFTTRLGEVSKLAREADESNKALRTSVMSQKNTTDNLQDHCHRLQQTVLLLEGKLRILQDQVVGFKVSLPENISISFAKGVSSANNGDKQRKARSAKQDNKVRRKKTKSSVDSKRNAGLRSRG